MGKSVGGRVGAQKSNKGLWKSLVREVPNVALKVETATLEERVTHKPFKEFCLDGRAKQLNNSEQT